MTFDNRFSALKQSVLLGLGLYGIFAITTVEANTSDDETDTGAMSGMDSATSGVDTGVGAEDSESSGEGSTLGADTGPVDADGDGSYAADDCDDNDANRAPGLDEFCDGVDNDCDGAVDEDPIDQGTWYPDVDKDGFGDGSDPQVACVQPDDTIEDGQDCDDTDDEIHPDAFDWDDDGIDQDCDGSDRALCSDPDDMESYLFDYMTWNGSDGGGSCSSPGTIEEVLECVNSIPEPRKFSDFLWSLTSNSTFNFSCTNSDTSAQAVTTDDDLRCFFRIAEPGATDVSGVLESSVFVTVQIQDTTMEIVGGDPPAIQIPAHVDFPTTGSVELLDALVAANDPSTITYCQNCHDPAFPGPPVGAYDYPLPDGSTYSTEFIEFLNFGSLPLVSDDVNDDPAMTWDCENAASIATTMDKFADILCEMSAPKSEAARRALALAQACAVSGPS